MSDLVSGLLAKLDEIERMTLAAKPHWQQLLWSRRAGNEKMNAYLTQVADPDDALRLCRAHRDLTEAYVAVRDNPDRLTDAALHLSFNLLRQVVETIARGLGVEDKEN